MKTAFYLLLDGLIDRLLACQQHECKDEDVGSPQTLPQTIDTFSLGTLKAQRQHGTHDSHTKKKKKETYDALKKTP